MIGEDRGPWPLAATCSRGLEPVLAQELRGFGLGSVEAGRGVVTFAGDLRDLYRTNLQLRTAMRVLTPLVRGSVTSRDRLYELVGSVGWENLLGRRQSFAVEVAGRCRAINNTNFGAQVVKDAIADRLRDRWGGRPDVDREDPDLRVHLHLADGVSTLSLDSTGEPLSHRGYRPRGGPAPLSESLAAGILMIAHYDGSIPLVDPMCGTGTFAIEAAMIATNTAPGMHRSFSFERWALHEPDLFQEVRVEVRDSGRKAATAILASDRSPRAVTATRRNLKAAGMSRWVTIEQKDVGTLSAPMSGSLIVCNPPYGRRMSEVNALRGLYRKLGARLKSHATGCTAWVLLGEPRLGRELGMRPAETIPLYNGPIECSLARYDLKATSDAEEGSR